LRSPDLVLEDEAPVDVAFYRVSYVATPSLTAIRGLFGWVYALATGHMHRGLRDIGVYCLPYQAQTGAYVAVLTSRYPSLSGVA
jgi:uncharacterized protein DUF4389